HGIILQTKKFFLFTLLLCLFPAFAQQAEERFMETFELRPSELLYIQTSKGIYETGEDLWFKVYQLDAQSLGLSTGSETLYL
ncbi:MAG: hypothetical protein LUD15_15045, partial [Bacteroides sp.]|nr:hypothetical protein [Bacteroides sp.]